MNATQQIRERTLESVVHGDGANKLSCWKQTEKRKINVFCLKKTIPTKYQLNTGTAKCHDRQKNHNNLWGNLGKNHARNGLNIFLFLLSKNYSKYTKSVQKYFKLNTIQLNTRTAWKIGIFLCIFRWYFAFDNRWLRYAAYWGRDSSHGLHGLA